MFFPLCLYFSSSFLFSLGCCRFYKDFFPALYIQIQEIKYTIHTHIYTCLYLCLHIVMTNYKYIITMFSLNKRNNKNYKINTKIYQHDQHCFLGDTNLPLGSISSKKYMQLLISLKLSTIDWLYRSI